ncbi:MAG TPA: FecR domain-containing protein [Candidatus Acidoferrales bacterium]|jgi:FecR protein|nr:FecR domain-containing protein [Candidatus Acidoferrales bacterium]
MKYIQTLITMVVVGAVMALDGSAKADSVKPCIVTVVRVQGQARYSLGDNSWHPLVVGKVLRSGAIIQSAVDSSVDIVLSATPVGMPQAAPAPTTMFLAPDSKVRGFLPYAPAVQQNVIRLWGNTVLAVDKLTQFDTGVQTVSDTELDLRAGRIFFNIKKMSATSRFIIKIPNGVAGIRGSYGYWDANGDGGMGDGSMLVSIIDSTGKAITQLVNAGFQFSAQSGTVSPLPAGVLNSFAATSTALSTSYQGDGAQPTPGQDTTQSYCSTGTGVKE